MDFAGKRSLPLRQQRPDGSALSGLPKPFALCLFVRISLSSPALHYNKKMAATANTKHQLKTIQKIEHNLAYMDYAMIFCL